MIQLVLVPWGNPPSFHSHSLLFIHSLISTVFLHTILFLHSSFTQPLGYIATHSLNNFYNKTFMLPCQSNLFPTLHTSHLHQPPQQHCLQLHHNTTHVALLVRLYTSLSYATTPLSASSLYQREWLMWWKLNMLNYVKNK